MAVFLGLLALMGLIKQEGAAFWRAAPEYWIYPLQTVLCAGLLVWFWRAYDFGRLRFVLPVILVGAAVFFLWIAPQAFLGFEGRWSGFNPDLFAESPALYWSTLFFRFARLVVVVPLVEEIFWRGFLLRYLVREDFTAVPFGTFSWFSFVAVTLAFGFTHSPGDWVAALLCGMIYNGVAYWTKSLSSCVLVHAVTNLLLGIWIMRTGQWGFW